MIGEAVVGGVGGKVVHKKNAAADGRNRKALGDIGNLVTVRGIDPKPNRPITRYLSNLSLMLVYC